VAVDGAQLPVSSPRHRLLPPSKLLHLPEMQAVEALVVRVGVHLGDDLRHAPALALRQLRMVEEVRERLVQERVGQSKPVVPVARIVSDGPRPAMGPVERLRAAVRFASSSPSARQLA
jgi:hypothetical protein